MIHPHATNEHTNTVTGYRTTTRTTWHTSQHVTYAVANGNNATFAPFGSNVHHGNLGRATSNGAGSTHRPPSLLTAHPH
ncbi:hypothetical protein V5P93_007088 [Actinokineospora auranticolor]|uniref:hypothetical protein n=1 Tax=Actinokineospora auranticolor TaxID=155976 RepID=UPI001FE2D226|nr:hypothetical protein [Actinokineospora auranticolor]